MGNKVNRKFQMLFYANTAAVVFWRIPLWAELSISDAMNKCVPIYF